MNLRKIFQMIKLWLETRDKEERLKLYNMLVEELQKTYSDIYRVKAIEVLRNENGIKVILTTFYNDKETYSYVKYYPAIDIYEIMFDNNYIRISSKN